MAEHNARAVGDGCGEPLDALASAVRVSESGRVECESEAGERGELLARLLLAVLHAPCPVERVGARRTPVRCSSAPVTPPMGSTDGAAVVVESALQLKPE